MLAKRNSILKRTAIAAIACVAIALLGAAALNFRASRRLQDDLDAIRSAGEPATLADLAGASAPTEINAAARLAALTPQVQAIEGELQPLSKQPDGGGAYYHGQDLTDAGAALVRDAFQSHPQLCDTLTNIAESAEYSTLLDLTLSPLMILESQMDQVQQVRGAMRVLRHRAELSLFEGQHADAARAGLTGLRLARLADREPFLVAYLVSLAVRGMALSTLEQAMKAGPLDANMRQAIDDELARHDSMDGLVHALRTERVLGVALSRTQIPWPAAAMWWFKNDQSAYLKLMSGQLRLGAAPLFRIAQQHQTLVAQVPPSAHLTQSVLPALDAVRQAADRVRSTIRCLRAANRLQVLAAAGQIPPEQLQEWGLPAEATQDPFDGKALRVRTSDQSWSIYSVGPNGNDDGGKMEDLLDIGVGPLPARFQ